MFDKIFYANSLPYSHNSQEHRKLYNNIAYSTDIDSVCPMVLRALLKDRISKEIQDGQTSTPPFSYYDTRINVRTNGELVCRYSDYVAGENEIAFIGVSNYTKAILDQFAEELSKFENYTELKRVREFFKTVDTICFIDVKNKFAIVIYDASNIRNSRVVLQGIPAYLPWYFQECPPDEDEMRLLKSLSKSSSEEFEAAIEVLAKRHNLRNSFLEIAMTDFEKKYMQAKEDSVKREIRSLKDRLDSYYSEITVLSKQLRDKQWYLIGCQNAQQGIICNGLEYLQHNENVLFADSTGGTLYINCKGYLECFDEQIAEEFIDNSESIIYRYSCFSDEVTKKLFKKIFIDKEIKIKMVAKYAIDLENMKINGISRDRYLPEVKDYMPNPHIHFYACLGDYATMMSEAVRQGDLIQCFELCLMSTRSLNFADSTVMESFLQKQLSTHSEMSGKYFELADGTSVDLTTVIKKIKEEIKKEEESNEQND